MKFFIIDFFSKCDQIRRKLPIWSCLLKKSLIETSFFVQWLLSLMFKSIASKYEDVVAMVPLTKMDSSILYEFWMTLWMQLPLLVMMSWFLYFMVTSQISSSIRRSYVLISPLHLYPTLWTSIEFYTSSLIQHISSNTFITIFKNNIIFECPKYAELTISPNFRHIIWFV